MTCEHVEIRIPLLPDLCIGNTPDIWPDIHNNHFDYIGSVANSLTNPRVTRRSDGRSIPDSVDSLQSYSCNGMGWLPSELSTCTIHERSRRSAGSRLLAANRSVLGSLLRNGPPASGDEYETLTLTFILSQPGCTVTPRLMDVRRFIHVVLPLDIDYSTKWSD